jgi:ankyrin repeat protein
LDFFDPAFVAAVSTVHASFKQADHEEVERLLAYGKCQVNEIDKFGQTALHVAAFEGHLNVVDVLLRKGVNIQLQDKNGWTALHSAAHAAHLHICEKLLLEGCDPNITVRTRRLVACLVKKKEKKKEKKEKTEKKKERI